MTKDELIKNIRKAKTSDQIIAVKNIIKETEIGQKAFTKDVENALFTKELLDNNDVAFLLVKESLRAFVRDYM